MTNKTAFFYVDISLSPRAFNEQLDLFIEMCESTHKSIPLPIAICNGGEFVGQLALLLAAIDCGKCDSICCKRNLGDTNEDIGLLRPEVSRFVAQGAKIEQVNEDEFSMEFPCVFCSGEGPGYNCSIYEDRPLSCTIFPFQDGCFFGEEKKPALAVNSACPEGRRIAKKVYLFVYEFRHKLSKTMTGFSPE
ncbi:MAG: YkgJ family cysteine cluster protein [Eubacteriales bacterium]|jgi:Fe-S-cluster containining protein